MKRNGALDSRRWRTPSGERDDLSTDTSTYLFTNLDEQVGSREGGVSKSLDRSRGKPRGSHLRVSSANAKNE
jgi:hypothetical protein